MPFNSCFCESKDLVSFNNIKGHNIIACQSCGMCCSDKITITNDVPARQICQQGSMLQSVLTLPKIRSQKVYSENEQFDSVHSVSFFEYLSKPFDFIRVLFDSYNVEKISGESYSISSNEFKILSWQVFWVVPHQVLWYWSPEIFVSLTKKFGFKGKVKKVESNKFFYEILIL